MPDRDSLAESAYPVSGVTMREVLEQPHLRGTDILAGAAGLDRVVTSINVMENPDILPWVKAGELLITVGYSLSRSDSDIERLIRSLAELDLAGFGIKLGRYVTDVGAEALAVADEMGFPVLGLPTMVSFDDIINDLYAAQNSLALGEINRSYDIERGLMHLALQGASPSDIAEEFGRAVDSELLYVGADNRVVIKTGGCEPATDADGRIAGSDLAGWLKASVVAGSVYVGQLHVLPGDDPAPELTGLVPRCAQVMALAASRELAVAAVDRQFHAQLLGNILNGRLDDVEVARRCRAIEWRLAFPAVVIAGTDDSGDGAASLERAHTQMQTTLRAAHRGAPSALIDRHLVAVVGDAAFTPEAAQQRGVAVAEQVQRSLADDASLSWGVSAAVEGPSGLARGWKQAALAAGVGPAIQGRSPVMPFAELGVYRVLSHVHPGILSDYARDTLGDLADEASRDDPLRQTLRVLLDTNLNTAETARRLHYHYNTVRYRVEQLEKRLGPLMSDANRCVELRVALMICDMRSVQGYASQDYQVTGV